MTSFTNNKPCNQAGKHTAQQDLSFIPVWHWTEEKKDGGRERKRKPKGNKEIWRQEKREQEEIEVVTERKGERGRVKEEKG